MVSALPSSTENGKNMTIVPSDNDVICGRGKLHARHPGNQRFTSVILASLEEYAHASSRLCKNLVIGKIVSYLRNQCELRFIKYNYATKEYTELTSDRIHEKVSHAIRDQIKHNEKSSRNRILQTKEKERLSSPTFEPHTSTCLSLPPSELKRICDSPAWNPLPSAIFDLGEVVENVGCNITNILDDDCSWEDAFYCPTKDEITEGVGTNSADILDDDCSWKDAFYCPTKADLLCSLVTSNSTLTIDLENQHLEPLPADCAYMPCLTDLPPSWGSFEILE